MPKTWLSCRAPAKVNLTLRILGKRPDGYHELETLMVPVSLHDHLRIVAEPAARPRVSCRVTGPERVPGGMKNLAARAADALMREVGISARVSIDLHKVIPFGAGLGGGSSDAAAVLRFLPRLLRRRVGRDRLMRLAAGLGADIPFFVVGEPAVASGIGEILSPLERFPPTHMVVVVPEARVETAWAYANALGGLTSRRANTRLARFSLHTNALKALVNNDFERGVGRAVPDIRRLKRRLRTLGAEATVLSGSGSAVAGMFPSSRLAGEAAAAFASPDKAFAVRVLRHSPAPDDGRWPSW